MPVDSFRSRSVRSEFSPQIGFIFRGWRKLVVPMSSCAVEISLCDYKSVHTECRRHEDEHKWIASQHAGRDLGEEAIRQWVRQHWHGYLRARWVEHLQGVCFWIELEQCDFGLLRREFHDQKPLLDEILGRLKNGGENLPILWWAHDQGYDWDQVNRIINILTALDVNSARLLHRSELPPPVRTPAEDEPQPHLASARCVPGERPRVSGPSVRTPTSLHSLQTAGTERAGSAEPFAVGVRVSRCGGVPRPAKTHYVVGIS